MNRSMEGNCPGERSRGASGLPESCATRTDKPAAAAMALISGELEHAHRSCMYRLGYPRRGKRLGEDHTGSGDGTPCMLLYNLSATTPAELTCPTPCTIPPSGALRKRRRCPARGSAAESESLPSRRAGPSSPLAGHPRHRVGMLQRMA